MLIEGERKELKYQGIAVNARAIANAEVVI